MDNISQQEASRRRTRGVELEKEENRSGYPQTSIGVLASFNVNWLPPYLKETLIRSGLYADVYVGEHDQIAQEILDLDSGLYSAAPNHILVIPAVEDVLAPIFDRPSALDEEEIDLLVDNKIDELSNLLNTVLQRLPDAFVYVTAFGSYDAPMEHILDPSLSGRGQAAVERWLSGVRNMGRTSPRLTVVDWDWHTRSVGLNALNDKRLWYLGRMRLNPVGLAAFAELTAQHVSAALGSTRKVLVVDLDNTLWGEVVGEVGIEGLELGPDGVGLAFQDFQRELLRLYEVGVVLAICSKNNEEDVWAVFCHHSGMILQKDNFAAHRVNWQDKAKNLSELSEELGLGLDSFVFLDDSLIEREWVRTALPDVLVPELPTDPCHRPSFLQRMPFFRRISLTKADSIRTQSYKEQASRNSLRQTLGSLDEFLISLNQSVTISELNSGSIGRAAQMCQRTNQFNLTTQRYSVADFENFIVDQSVETYTLSVSDRFGDSGVTGLGVLKFQGNEAVIDTFLLSCRVLGRKVEDVFLDYLVARADTKGSGLVIGEYVPSGKNKQVEDFYVDHGFVPSAGGRFSLNLSRKSYIGNTHKYAKVITDE